MNTMQTAVSLGLSLACALAGATAGQDSAAEPEPIPALTTETFAAWRAEIAPRPEEVAWLDVGWRPSLWEAVIDAQRERKPILLWTMNGHPMGCT